MNRQGNDFNMVYSLIGLVILASTLVACESAQKNSENSAATVSPHRSFATDSAPQAVADSNNELGFRLVGEAVKLEQADKKPRNILISPISAHVALSMALNGTANATRGQFLDVLNFKSMSVDTINDSYRNLLQQMIMLPATKEELSSEASLPAWQQSPKPVFTIQNSAWATNGTTSGSKYTFRPTFTNALKANYGVGASKSLDFMQPASAGVINSWTSDATNGMIPEIVDAQTLSSLVWILLNTSYLEARWEAPFRLSGPQDFTGLSGSVTQVPMMSHNGSARFYSNSSVQVAELAFAKTHLKAYVVLPVNADDFYTLQTRENGVWTSRFWSQIFPSFQEEVGFLRMPKFTFSDGVTMKRNEPFTKDMGLNFLFQDTADLSNMDGVGSSPSQVGIIKQNSKIEWSENGVKAAAATMVGGMPKSIGPRSAIQMIVNRPFYFAIYDETTKMFLFLGQVVNPL